MKQTINQLNTINRFLKWGPECSKPREGVNMDKQKTAIIDLHNSLRERLSRAPPIDNLPQAKYLPKLLWDHELSILAMRVTNFCNDDKVSECANTSRFLNVGRSSWISELTKLSPSEYVKSVITDLAFKNFTGLDESFASSFPLNTTKRHRSLANIINQKAKYVGCGMLSQGFGKSVIFYFTCLYNESVRTGQKLYDTLND